MKTASRDFIESCIEDISARIKFLKEKIASSEKELHYFKAELTALEYALLLMNHELSIRVSMETRLRDRKNQIVN
jgi:hypothetical protein